MEEKHYTGENNEYGQQLRDTFYLSDVYVKMSGDNDEAKEQIQKYIRSESTANAKDIFKDVI